MIGQHKQRKDKGQSLVEFALLLPILLIILAGVVDLGRLYYVYVVLTDAAAEGATYAAIHPPDDPDDTNSEVHQRTLSACGGMSDEVQSVVVSCPTCPNTSSGDQVTVTVNYEYGVITPVLHVMFPSGKIDIQAVATEVIIAGELGN